VGDELGGEEWVENWAHVVFGAGLERDMGKL